MPEQHWIAIEVSPEDPNRTALLLEPNHNRIARSFQTAVCEAGKNPASSDSPLHGV